MSLTPCPSAATLETVPGIAERIVVIVAFDGVQPLDVTGPHEVFAGANEALAYLFPKAPTYRLQVVSVDGGLVVAESGLRLGADPLSSVPGGPIDVLLLPGGAGVNTACAEQRLVDFVTDVAPRARRIVTVCSGTFLAAGAGLLDGRRVTTHWARAKELQATHPAIDVDADPIFVRDGNVWTSAGVTAGIDLALALVEDDHGAEVAQLVARWLVMFLRRPGGQTQFATPVWNERPAHGPIRAAQESIDADPGGDHRVMVLAERVGMSERHFIRCFSSSVGATPAQYVAAVRTEAARRALESTPDTVEAIARRCGFGTGETLRRTFARRLGVSPDAYRQRFST
ncbi:MAG TPA: DJ-1/PfpI family protein [Ilumatobacteraceae bacterium]|nr:DJ-1/PfpI family protein [Ilumatobacteraceae bacterium]